MEGEPAFNKTEQDTHSASAIHSAVTFRLSQKPARSISPNSDPGWNTVYHETVYETHRISQISPTAACERFSYRVSHCCKHTVQDLVDDGSRAKCSSLKLRVKCVSVPMQCKCRGLRICHKSFVGMSERARELPVLNYREAPDSFVPDISTTQQQLENNVKNELSEHNRSATLNKESENESENRFPIDLKAFKNYSSNVKGSGSTDSQKPITGEVSSDRSQTSYLELNADADAIGQPEVTLVTPTTELAVTSSNDRHSKSLEFDGSNNEVMGGPLSQTEKHDRAEKPTHSTHLTNLANSSIVMQHGERLPPAQSTISTSENDSAIHPALSRSSTVTANVDLTVDSQIPQRRSIFGRTVSLFLPRTKFHSEDNLWWEEPEDPKLTVLRRSTTLVNKTRASKSDRTVPKVERKELISIEKSKLRKWSYTPIAKAKNPQKSKPSDSSEFSEKSQSGSDEGQSACPDNQSIKQLAQAFTVEPKISYHANTVCVVPQTCALIRSLSHTVEHTVESSERVQEKPVNTIVAIIVTAGVSAVVRDVLPCCRAVVALEVRNLHATLKTTVLITVIRINGSAMAMTDANAYMPSRVVPVLSTTLHTQESLSSWQVGRHLRTCEVHTIESAPDSTIDTNDDITNPLEMPLLIGNQNDRVVTEMDRFRRAQSEPTIGQGYYPRELVSLFGHRWNAEIDVKPYVSIPVLARAHLWLPRPVLPVWSSYAEKASSLSQPFYSALDTDEYLEEELAEDKKPMFDQVNFIRPVTIWNPFSTVFLVPQQQPPIFVNCVPRLFRRANRDGTTHTTTDTPSEGLSDPDETKLPAQETVMDQPDDKISEGQESGMTENYGQMNFVGSPDSAAELLEGSQTGSSVMDEGGASDTSINEKCLRVHDVRSSEDLGPIVSEPRGSSDISHVTSNQSEPGSHPAVVELYDGVAYDATGHPVIPTDRISGELKSRARQSTDLSEDTRSRQPTACCGHHATHHSSLCHCRPATICLVQQPIQLFSLFDHIGSVWPMRGHGVCIPRPCFMNSPAYGPPHRRCPLTTVTRHRRCGEMKTVHCHGHCHRPRRNDCTVIQPNSHS